MINDRQREFLDAIWASINYWENEDRAPTSRDKLEGLAFSFLVILDGESSLCGPYRVIPYCCRTAACNDITGELHDNFYSYRD